MVGKLQGVVTNGIGEHLERYDLVRDDRRESVRGASCLTDLLSFYGRVLESICKGMGMLVPPHRLLNGTKESRNRG